MNILVFDIETVPDVAGGRKLHDFKDLSDAEVAQAMFFMRKQKTGGSEFLPHHLQKIVAISVVMRRNDNFKVWSIGDESSEEKELIQRFYDGLERYSPTLVSWNGSGFDLPVLHYRSLLQGVPAPRYWEKGSDDPSFKWNNYLSRYHERHTDLMDVLAGYTGRANAPLDQIATLLDFPGKMGMSGAKVWDNYLDGDLAGIRNYCETDVLNTYLVYCRFLYIQGKLSEQAYQEEIQLVRDNLLKSGKTHLIDFANACKGVN
jgi:predicted PolB exonuclease-like 3'-5' exonuclease